MKKLLVISIAIAAFALVVKLGLREGAAQEDGGGGISLGDLAGNYSNEAKGSLSVCLDSSKFPSHIFVTIDCGAATAVAIPQTLLTVGNLTRNEKGDGCSTVTFVESSLPVDITPPLVGVTHSVSKVTSYDAATGTGNSSVTNYRGGSCNGSTFDSAGATATGTVHSHFVASNGGRRIDGAFTSYILYVTDTTGNFVGDFSVSFTQLKQEKEG
jgi:hypothetical protein